MDPTSPSGATAEPAVLEHLYEQRFDEADLRFKRQMWEVLCREVFQRWVPERGTVLDLGAGSCEFSNAIKAGRRIAVDLNPATARCADAGVEVVATSITDLAPIPSGSVDAVFSSNVLEHMPDKAAVLQALREAERVLRPGGRLLVLMPNIRVLPGAYWDYFDHHTPLSDRSLGEACGLAGLEVERSVARFLPYTVKGAAAKRSVLALRAYLKLKPAWRLFGRQMLVVARKP